MKKIIGIMLASTVLTTSAFSNAAPAPACPACPSVAAKWSGVKFGGQLGYGHTSNKLLTGDFSLKGVLGGLHAGYDHQTSKNMILGMNASLDFSGMKGKVGDDLKYSSKWTVAVVPRVGLVAQDSLLYAGAGWAATKFEVKNAPAQKGKKTMSGLRLQAGAAQKMNKVLMGVEANYDFHGKKKLISSDTGSAVKPRTLSAMLKVSYMM